METMDAFEYFIKSILVLKGKLCQTIEVIKPKFYCHLNLKIDHEK